MTPEQESALRVLRNELLDSIDGGEECHGRDTQITRWLNLVDLALGIPVEPWAALALKPDLDAVKAPEPMAWYLHIEGIGDSVYRTQGAALLYVTTYTTDPLYTLTPLYAAP